MADGPQIDWDIFVSYRHATDISDGRWVEDFKDRLALKLEDLIGEKVRVWFDKAELRAGNEWRPEIDDALDSAAIFLAIISRSYFRSEVCRQEMDRFLGLYKQADASRSRLIFPIFKQPPISEEEVPPDINAIHRPRQFYRYDPPGFEEFAPAGKTSDEYFEAFSKVAQELAIQLDRIRGRGQRQIAGKIYLAEVGRELQRERDNLQADLFQRRYGVLPDRCYIWNASNIAEEIEADLKTVDLCVHMISRATPRRAEIVAHCREQLDRAVDAMSRAGKPPPVVWIQPGAQGDSKEVSALIEYVKSDLPEHGVEVLECGLEEFKSYVIGQLPKPNPLPTITCTSAGDIALLHDSADTVAAKPLKMLLQSINCEPVPVRVSQGGVMLDANQIRIPESCSRCIVYWGSQSECWVRDVIAAKAFERYRSKERGCLYFAEPASDEKEAFVTGKVRTIKGNAADQGLAELSDLCGAYKQTV